MPLPVFPKKSVLATCVAAILCSPLLAQDLPLGPRSDYGKVVLTARQAAGQEVTLEQMFGGSFDSEPLHVYGAGSLYRELGKAVGRLDVLTSKGTAFCTAFLISDTHLMTNHHCLNVDGATVQQASFLAGYLEEGIKDDTERYMVNVTPIEQDEDLDFAIVEVFGKPSPDWGTLSLSALEFDPDLHAGHALFIIGHPQRLAQHISRKECRSAARKPVTSNRLRHTCDTLVGNSGSPIFDDENRVVVALHNSGSAKDGINFGIPISMIAQKSQIVASLVAPVPIQPDAPRPDPKSVAINTCEAALSRAQSSDACEDWSDYMQTCTSHPMRPFVKAHVDAICARSETLTLTVSDDLVAGTPGKVGPEPKPVPLVDRMASDPDARRCDALAGSQFHPDRSKGKMLEEGRDFEEIDAPLAIAHCQAALTRFADHPRLLATLGRALIKAERDDEALIAYRKAAALGDPLAQAGLGHLYRVGQGVTPPDMDAVEWFRQAADQGFAIGQFNLGWMYENGRGLDRSYKDAMHWYRQAADQGLAPAQNAVGALFSSARGVTLNHKSAAKWFELAARQGYAPAQANMGWMFEHGYAAPRSYSRALDWYRKAAAQGNSAGIEGVARLADKD